MQVRYVIAFLILLLSSIATFAKGVELVISQLSKTNPKAKGQTPESLRVLDGSVLDEIKKSGFIEKVKG